MGINSPADGSIVTFLSLAGDAPGPKIVEPTDLGASIHFSRMIQSKFEAAPEELANQLGQLNSERWARLGAERNANIGSIYFPEIVSSGPKSTVFHDSGIGTSLPSVKQVSNIAPSLHSTLVGRSRSRLPTLPQNAKTDPFLCAYCGKMLRMLSQREYE